MKKTLFVTAALLMGSACYASANIENKQTMINGNAELRGQYHQRPTFALLDSNGDGVLSKDEVRGRLLTNFDKFDTDGSGALESDELAAIKKNRQGKYHKRPTFAQLDSNADGVLTKDEVRGRLLTNFDKFDTDRSGTLSSDEFAAIKKNRPGKHHQRPTFAQFDSNGDGVLSKDEVRGRLLTNFDKFDTDRSGTLSSDEFAAIKKNRPGKHHQRPTFAQLDSNADGVLSKDEVRGRLLTNFDKFDTDDSGALSSDEFAAIKKNRPGKHHQRPTFAQLDSNADGVLTKDEVRGRLLTNFDKFDTDGSGALSIDEFAAIKKNRPGKHHQRPTFAQFDSNGDGVLSKDEVRGRLLTNFDKFDTDGSGTLSSDEFAAIKKNRQGKHHKRPTFAQLDSNADGVLSKDEVRGRLLTNFDKFDTDGSGALSIDEFAAIKKN